MLLFLTMALLPVRAALVPITTLFEKNGQPMNIYDKISGVAGEVCNSMFRFANINVTVTESSTMGKCLWVDGHTNCSGIFAELINQETDLSLSMLYFKDYEDRDLSTNILYGPQVREPNQVFMATAQFPGRTAILKPIQILKQVPEIVVFLNFVVLFLIILVINFKLKSRDKRIAFLDVIVLQTQRWSRGFKANHRRIVVIFSVIYFVFCNNIYVGYIKSDLVTVVPPKYLQSLEDIVRYNRTPTLFDGLFISTTFKQSNNSIKRTLLQRAKKRGSIYNSKSKMFIMAHKIQNDDHVGLFGGRTMAKIIKASMCLTIADKTEELDLLPTLKQSDSFFKTQAGFLYSKSVNHELRQRIDRTIIWFFDTGQFGRISNLATGQFGENVSPFSQEVLMNCVERLNREKKKEPPEIQFKMEIFAFFLNLLFIGFGAGLAALVLEIIDKKIRCIKTCSSLLRSI